MSDAAVIQVVELIIGPFVAVAVSYLLAGIRDRRAVAKAHQAAQAAQEALDRVARVADMARELKVLHELNAERIAHGAGRLDARDQAGAPPGPLVVVAVEGAEKVEVDGGPASRTPPDEAEVDQ